MNNGLYSVLLTPFDTLFFRDHRPFEAGVQKYSRPLFPTPMTFMGALSHAYFEKNGKSKRIFFGGTLDEQLGKYDADLTGKGESGFSIKGLFLVDHRAIFIPTPAHHLTRKNTGGAEYSVKAMFPRKRARMQIPEDDFEYRDGMVALNKFLNISYAVDLNEYDNGLIQEEKRVGIAIDKSSNSTEEGALYFTTHQRLKHSFKKKSSFMICYQTANGKELNMMDVLRLGGESRLVFTEKTAVKEGVDKNLMAFLKKLKNHLDDSWSEDTFRFMVYLLTPAIFKNGWQPEAWPWKERAELIAACVPKAVWVSGFKITKGRGGEPRPLYKAAPAGSVYFFESQDEKLKQELKDGYILGKSVSEIYPQAGFGMTLLNSWDYQNKNEEKEA